MDSKSATVAVVAAEMGSTVVVQPGQGGTVGEVTTMTPTDLPAELILAAEVLP